jgi:hypothetical protein
MAVDHVKSTHHQPRRLADRRQHGRRGRPAPLKTVDGYATAVASSSADATYQLRPHPSNCKVKKICSRARRRPPASSTSASTTRPTARARADRAARRGAIDQDFFASA